MNARPSNVGIKAMEIYFPRRYVDQSDLERFMLVSPGKFTIGLGQKSMSFCDDREDIISMALTAVSSLLEKYSIDPKSIGRLEVGTESPLDKSKSCKSALMQLFEPSGNHDIEGIDTFNACYGGTSAFFNAVNWVESSSWDGRDAIVVAGDIALYKEPSARPTGGAGCVAMLVGADAPLALEAARGSFMRHVYDFYKPDFKSEYPLVDGHYSIKCYLEAVDECYKKYFEKRAALAKDTNGAHLNGIHDDQPPETPLDSFDYFAFHAPTCKVVSKSYARLLYNDYLANPGNPIFNSVSPEIAAVTKEASYSEKSIEKTFTLLSKERLDVRVKPATIVPNLCGNMYCGSVWGSLVSLLCHVDQSELQGKRVGMFSYGSGLASSLFSFRVVGNPHRIARAVNLQQRMESRTRETPEVYDEICRIREIAYQAKGYVPKGDINSLFPGTYYLAEVNERFQRRYEKNT